MLSKWWYVVYLWCILDSIIFDWDWDWDWDWDYVRVLFMLICFSNEWCVVCGVWLRWVKKEQVK